VLSFIARNFRLKLLALAIAMGMWVIVMGQDRAEVTVEVPVEIAGIPPNLVLSGEVANKVSARIIGPASLVRRVATEAPVKRVDLSGMAAGEHVFQVVPQELKLPGGVLVTRISPARFTITLVKKLIRKVPVRPVLKGQPAQGHEVAEVAFRPAIVVVSGSPEALETVDWVWTVPLEVTGLTKDTTLVAAVRPPHEQAVRIEPAEVEALIKVTSLKSGPAPAPRAEEGKKTIPDSP